MPYVFLDPVYDIIIFSLLVYILEYSIFKYIKADLLELKYMIIGWFVDIFIIVFVGFVLWYYWSNTLFPFWLNWFFYTIIVAFILEFSVIKLFDFKLS